MKDSKVNVELCRQSWSRYELRLNEKMMKAESFDRIDNPKMNQNQYHGRIEFVHPSHSHVDDKHHCYFHGCQRNIHQGHLRLIPKRSQDRPHRQLALLQ